MGLKAGVTFARVRLESADGEEERTYTMLIASGELFRRYDGNGNREIDRDEVLMAVRDYFDGLLTRDGVIGWYSWISLRKGSSGRRRSVAHEAPWSG